MNNVILGKTLKAMYKLSGKTLAQLSEESELTVDTINNLFYARVQKPGFIGICDLVEAMGFNLHILMGFFEKNGDEISECDDITEKFAKYVDDTIKSEDGNSSLNSVVKFSDMELNNTVKDKIAEAGENRETVEKENLINNMTRQIELINREHEKQLDRFKANHTNYIEKIEKRYGDQLAKVEKELRYMKIINVFIMIAALLVLFWKG